MRPLPACLLAHLLLARLLPSPWVVPDLTVLGMVVAIIGRPERWWQPAVCVGLWMMLWAVRDPMVMVASSLAVGWTVRAIASQWDVSDPAAQGWLVAGASVVLGCELLWLAQVSSITVVVLAVSRALLTGALVPVVRAMRPVRS